MRARCCALPLIIDEMPGALAVPVEALIRLDNIVRDTHVGGATSELPVDHGVEEPHRLGVGAQAHQVFHLEAAFD